MIDEELRLSLSATEAISPSVSSDIANPPWAEASARILLLRLSPLADVEGSTSHLVLFSECRAALPDAYLDFGFFPSGRDRSLLASRGLPLFYGLESGMSPADFDLILLSNSFALELVNLPYLYAGTGIPARASERARATSARTGAERASDGPPILILGGSNASCVGSLLYPGAETEEASDCLVDGVFFGEGEGAIGDIARALAEPGASRAERIAAASSIEGLWIALSGKIASRRRVLPHPPALERYPKLNTSSASTAKLQISAGCPGYCAFCLEGWEFRPYRELGLAEVLRSARELKKSSGASSVELYSYNFNAHSEIYELVFELNRIFRRVNFMSQRLDILADSPSLVPFELAAEKRSFTLGIEGISERMRSYYRKGVDSVQIDEAIRALALPAVREIKLFYILAGIENEDDIAEFSDSLAKMAEIRDRKALGTRILVSAGYLVRLPFTPLQYAPLCLDRSKLEGIASRLESAAAAHGIEFRLAADFEEYEVDQILALGGPALAPWIEGCPSRGIVYDVGLSKGTGADLEAFARAASLLGPAFEAEKSEAWRPALAFADDNHEALRKLYLRATAFSPKGGSIPSPKGGGEADLHRLERLMEAKRRLPSILVRLTFPREMDGTCDEYRSSRVMREILAASPDAIHSVFDAEDVLEAKGGPLESLSGRYWGRAIYRIVGADASRLEAAAAAAGFEALDPSFAPGRIEAELEVPAALAARVEASLKAYLADERVAFVERRVGAGGRSGERLLEIPTKSAKKGLILGARLLDPAPGSSLPFEIKLSLGPKARLSSWLSHLDTRVSRASSLRIASITECTARS
jgi:radical SAM superfamily enzyme YgiQ (UPF0313 family)